MTRVQMSCALLWSFILIAPALADPSANPAASPTTATAYSETDPASLASALKSWVPEKRAYALGHLGELGPKAQNAIPQMLLMLDEYETIYWPPAGKQTSIGVIASEAIAKIGQPAVRPLMEELKKQTHPSWNWMEALRLLGKLTYDPAAKDLQSADPAVRRVAALALGACRDPRAQPLLIAALSDQNKEVFRAAVQALGNCSGPQVVQALLDTYRARKPSSWGFEIRDALKSAATPDCVPLLIREMENTSDQTVLYILKEVLGTMGPAAVDPLIALLNNANFAVRREAAEALALIKDPKAIKPLLAAWAAGVDGNLTPISRALQSIGNKDAGPLILDDVERDGKIRDHDIIYALRSCADERILPRLLNLFHDEKRPWARNFAAAGLAGVGKAATPYLLQDLENPNQWIRFSAMESLSYIQDEQAYPVIRKIAADASRPEHKFAAQILESHERDKRSKARQAAMKQALQAPLKSRQTLLAELQSPNACIRWDAATALDALFQTQPAQTFQVLAQEDETNRVRWMTQIALGEILDREVIEKKLPAAVNGYTRSKTVERLAGMGNSAIPALIAALGDPDTETSGGIAENAQKALIQMGKPATPALLTALGKQNGNRLRAGAARVLAQMPDPRAFEDLVAMLDAMDAGLRASAASALVALKDRRAIPSLAQSLEKFDFEDIAAFQALGEFADERTVRVLARGYLMSEWRDQAREALLRIGEKGAPNLVQAFVSGEPGASQLAYLVEEIGEPAIPELEKALGTSAPTMRGTIENTIKNIKIKAGKH